MVPKVMMFEIYVVGILCKREHSLLNHMFTFGRGEGINFEGKVVCQVIFNGVA